MSKVNWYFYQKLAEPCCKLPVCISDICTDIPAQFFEVWLHLLGQSAESFSQYSLTQLGLKLVQAPQYFLLLAVPRRLFCFGSLVILDVARCYLWLFTLYINIKIDKNSC